jgi:prepilin-type N-terminal cleavage/methylation domain-containing protein
VEGEPVKRGYTLLEMLVAVTILAVMISAVYAVLQATSSVYDFDTSLRNKQYDLQRALEVIGEDMKECSVNLIRTQAVADPSYPPNPAPPKDAPPYGTAQTLIIIPSARISDPNGPQPNTMGGFQVTGNASPSWQSIILYLPWWNAALDRGELHRYVVSGASAAYFQPSGTPPAITVTATTITVPGAAVIERKSGQVFAPNIQSMSVTLTSGAWVMSLTSNNVLVGRGYTKVTQAASMESANQGRN